MRDSGQLFLVAHQGMVNAGLDVEAVYRRFGYNAQMAELNGARTPHEQQSAFWQAVEAVTGDADIGLHLCPHMPLYRADIIEYLMFSSRTFGEGITRAFKYLRLVSDALSARLVHIDDDNVQVRLVSSSLTGPQSRHTEVCVVYEMLQFASYFTEQQATPKAVTLRCPRISPVAEYEKVFGCPVTFGAEESAITFDPVILDYRSPHWDPDLLKLHEELAEKRLAGLERQDLIAQIRTLFSQRLELQSCELEDVAKELALSPRRLRFELTQAGTSFSQLLMEFRYALARHLLGRTDERIENIVYLTGFSEPSTFYRAFKRWSGLTPVQYRQQKQQSSATANGD